MSGVIGERCKSPHEVWSAAALGCVLCSFVLENMTFYRRNLPHIDKPGSTYYVSFSTKDKLFLPAEARSLIFDHCLFENGKTVQMHAFVVMPDHVHMLFTPLQKGNEQPHTLARIMNGIKGASAHSVNKLLTREGALWLPESFDRIV